MVRRMEELLEKPVLQSTSTQQAAFGLSLSSSFADVPNDLAQLRFSTSGQDDPTPCQNSHHNFISNSNNTLQSTQSTQSSPSTTLTAASTTTITTTTTTTTTNLTTGDDSPVVSAPATASTRSGRVQPRKPSPGLAARLKALGFGSSSRRQQSPPPHHDPVGRLPEDQLRQLDEGHQAGSESVVVERRGRPWKPGALVRIPSKASLKSSKASKKSPVSISDSASVSRPDQSPAPAPAPAPGSGPALEAATTVDFLPEIETAPPLEMDTHKYRLPDHTNGNGTKAQRETRQQHLDRGAAVASPLSPSPETFSPPPPPLPKDSPPLPPPPNSAPSTQQEFGNFDAASYFNPLGLQRPGSIYTLSRASFANQLAQLTSLQLPDAESLSGKVAAIPTAQAAARALVGAAEQIRNWISKASEVIGGLDSEDDVEWAAAGGREGLEEVESAITRFEELIKVYITAIEALNNRQDIASVSQDDLQRTVVQMDAITTEWANIHTTLKTVKVQVEIAMEWEELWNMVLGDIQNEMDELCRLVFEMEERRHKSMMASANGDGSVDIGDLETIVEETPPPQTARLAAAASHRFSIPMFPGSPSPSSPGAASSTATAPGGGVPSLSQDDSSLLALFARMQPLRASLDFLPMRLSVFEARAERTFPTACEELEVRRMDLDASYRKLEKDAENLRKELGEDRWVLVFRGAGRQAQKMYESVERSVAKLKEAVDAGMHLTNPPMMGKKIEGYEAKKTHYGPAVERVLSIIDRGLKDRLTVNGEILRLHAEVQGKWDELKDRMRDMDLTLEEMASEHKGQQLRDSISSMLSNDRSTIGSGHETPQSSPPSSVIMSGLGIESTTPTAKSTAAAAAAAAAAAVANTNKRRSSSMGSHLPQPTARRSVSATSAGAGAAPSQLYRKPVSRFATTGLAVPGSGRDGSVTPIAKRTNNPPRPNSTLGNRPRWNSSTVGVDTGHNFKPLSLTSQTGLTPSPKSNASPASSRLPLRSPLGRAESEPPSLAGGDETPSRAPPPPNRMSFRDRVGLAAAAAQGASSSGLSVPKPRLLSQASTSALKSEGNRRASLQPPRPGDSNINNVLGATTPRRPASSLATSSSRRTSLLPQPRALGGPGGPGSVSGRESPQAVMGARVAMRRGSSASAAGELKPAPKDLKPRWRN